MENQELPTIIPTAEPFFFSGNRIGCLMIHGFTGTPKEMRWMGEYLAGQGYTVMGVRLAGHSSYPQNMLRTTWHDWLLSAQDGYHMLRTSTDAVFLFGLSMGGILSLVLASQLPVAGVFTMSTPAYPPDPRLRYARQVSLVMPWVKKGPPDWRNPDAASQHAEYPEYPTRSFAQLTALLAVMNARLPLVKAPVRLVQSHCDNAIPKDSAELIYRSIGSRDKEILWLDESGHCVTEEPERMKIYRAAHEFIQKNA